LLQIHKKSSKLDNGEPTTAGIQEDAFFRDNEVESAAYTISPTPTPANIGSQQTSLCRSETKATLETPNSLPESQASEKIIFGHQTKDLNSGM
jgi:hypothetical protein